MDLEDSFASDTKMKESPIDGEGDDKAGAPHLGQLDEIKTEPDNAQVNILPFFFLEQHFIINFSYADAVLFAGNLKSLSASKAIDY